MDDNMFEAFVVNQEMEDNLEDFDWVPTDQELRTFRAFGGSRELYARAVKRQEEQDGIIDEEMP